MIPIEENKRINGKYTEWLTDDGLLRIEGWARDGLIDAQIAKNMGIAYSTFKEWVNRFPALSAALKRGKAPVDIEVENALLKRAKGYKYVETVTEIYKDADGVERRHIRNIEKEVPPDSTAIIYWLRNRKPQQWRDRRDISIETRTDADYRNMHTIAALINAPAPDIDISEVIADE